MAFYINDKGELREAIQHTGDKNAEKIRKKFGFRESVNALYLGNYYFRNDDGKMNWEAADYFEKRWRPISEARVRVIDQIQKAALLKLAERQHKNDDWREYSFGDLNLLLLSEGGELADELLREEIDIEVAQKECAYMVNFIAFIYDKLEGMKELDEMWNKEEDNE